MRFSHVPILLVLMVLNKIILVNSLKCYNCHSLYNECESLDEVEMVECKAPDIPNYTVACRVTAQHIYFRKPPEHHVIRECSSRMESDLKCVTRVWRDVDVRTCSCETDGCNIARSLRINWTILILALVMLFPP